jgi:hypothetical protein
MKLLLICTFFGLGLSYLSANELKQLEAEKVSKYDACMMLHSLTASEDICLQYKGSK